MRDELPEPTGFGSSTPRPQEANMNGSPSQRVSRERLRLFALLIFLAPTYTYASADIGATDRHEIPSFVLKRVDVMTDAGNTSCPPFCSQPDASARCAQQVPESATAVHAGIRPDRLAGDACGAGSAVR